MRCKQIAHALPGARVIQVFGEDLQHLLQRGHQFLAQFALARLDHLQFLLGSFVNGADAANEHLRNTSRTLNPSSPGRMTSSTMAS